MTPKQALPQTLSAVSNADYRPTTMSTDSFVNDLENHRVFFRILADRFEESQQVAVDHRGGPLRSARRRLYGSHGGQGCTVEHRGCIAGNRYGNPHLTRCDYYRFSACCF